METGYVETVMAQHPAMFSKLLANGPRFRFQVLLSHLVHEPGAHTSPRLLRHGYRVDEEYFYPASAIKLCATISAVGKLKQLEDALGPRVNCTTPISFYSLFEGTEADGVDPSNLNSKHITVAHEVRKIFLVSDNEAFNRLFSLVGHRTINQAMWDLGLQSTRLHHRLSEIMSSGANQYCEPIDLNAAGVELTLPPKHSHLVVQDNSGLPGVKVGNAYIATDGHLVPEPMDFSMKNYISLVDLQNLLMKLVRPDIEELTGSWAGMKLDTPNIKLDEGMRMLLMEAMAQYPSQSSNPQYDQSTYPDDYCKFFLPGVSRVCSKGALRIYNKIGRAYGFTIDNSYIVDIETGRNFFLTAVIYTNDNGVLNDDRYEYEIADCAMADLAEVLTRALWQIPPFSAALSTPFDCIPSSLWSACTRPLTTRSGCESEKEQVMEPISVGQEATWGGISSDLQLGMETEGQSPGLQQSNHETVVEAVSLTSVKVEGSQSLTSDKPEVQICERGMYSVLKSKEGGLLTGLSSSKSYKLGSLLAEAPHSGPDLVCPGKGPEMEPVLGTSIVEADSNKFMEEDIRPCYKLFLDE